MGEIFYKELNLTSSGVKLQSFTFLNLLKLTKQEFMKKFNFMQLPAKYEIADMGDCLEVLCYHKNGFTKTIELEKHEYGELYKAIVHTF